MTRTPRRADRRPIPDEHPHDRHRDRRGGRHRGGRLLRRHRPRSERRRRAGRRHGAGRTARRNAGAAATTVAQLSQTQRSEVEGIIKDYLASNPGFIRDYLIANPEVIRDAIDELQRKQDDEAQAAQVAAIGDNRDLLFSSPRQVVIGNPEGDVTLVEFFDYNCGYCSAPRPTCSASSPTTPTSGSCSRNSRCSATGSIEAAQVSSRSASIAPEKYGEFHDALIAESGQVDGDVALAVAEELGLDRTARGNDGQSDEVKATITEVYALGAASSA